MTDKWDKFRTFMNDRNFYNVLNSLDEGIHIVDNEGISVVYNKKSAEIDGLEPGEVLGKNILEVYPSLTEETSTLLKTLRTGKPIKNLRQTYINLSGKRVTTINSTFPLKFNNNKRGAIEILRDITQVEKLVNNISDLRSNLCKDCQNNNKNKNKQNNQNKVKENNTSYSFKDIVGRSENFKHVLESSMKAAGSDSSILLYGETGTGKELFAQGIHNGSRRRNKPFIAQNCSALPKDLLEGLLFGTRKGGFTGARTRAGLFEQADGGTILLDEINSMDPALQAKLLRVLEENRVRRVGAQKETEVDVRIIATMNTHPDRALKEDKLREDLYYRLSVVFLEIPPLRERRSDIPRLIEHFIDKYNREFSCSVRSLSRNLKEKFANYTWPGNVRELQHIIESAFNMVQNEEEINYQHIPKYFKDRLKNADYYSPGKINTEISDESVSLTGFLENIEIKMIADTLKETGGNISRAARRLNISRQSLHYKIKKYGINNA